MILLRDIGLYIFSFYKFAQKNNMKAITFIKTAIIACCFLAANLTSAFSQNYEKFMIGNWLGNIEFQGKNYKIVIVFSVSKKIAFG